jgi:hypothetical protein
VRFVGLWHSHPDGPAAPSPTDRQGMADLLVPVARAPRRALLAIVGGPPPRWSAWLDAGASPDLFVRLLVRISTVDGGRLPPRAGEGQSGPWWPGGYALGGPRVRAEQAVDAHAGRFSWWRRARRVWLRTSGTDGGDRIQQGPHRQVGPAVGTDREHEMP